MGVKAKMIAITTTSGTGSEVTPFAVVTDDTTGQKYPLADYALTPDMAIVDANLVMNMPKSLCAFGVWMRSPTRWKPTFQCWRTNTPTARRCKR